MALATWCRMVLVGEITSGQFAGESWQTGMSFVDGDPFPTFPNVIRQPLQTFEADALGQQTSTADFDIAWAWEGDSVQTKAHQEALAQEALVFWNAIKGKATNESRLIEIRIGAFDRNNKMINGNNVFALKVPVAGTVSGTSGMPPQIAVVASLQTGARGPGGRGRMFLPVNGCTPTETILQPADQTLLLNAVLALTRSMNQSGSATAAVVNKNAQTYSSIRAVRVGSHFDTQRRRANKTPEQYQSASV